MEIVLALFLIGCFFGSFFLVLIDRLPRGEKITGRSYCEKCKHVLSARDLVPIVSFAILRGKCRYCKTNLSYYYPFLELCTGIAFAVTYLLIQSRPLPEVVYLFVIISMLIVLFFADLRYGILPFPAIVVLFVATILFIIFSNHSLLLPHLLSGLGAFVFFLVIFLLTRGRGMGFGDVVYSLWMGVALGFPEVIFGLYIAFLTGAVISLILILLGLKKLRGDSIPFGPFLIFGTVVMLFWSQYVIEIVKRLLPI